MYKSIPIPNRISNENQILKGCRAGSGIKGTQIRLHRWHHSHIIRTIPTQVAPSSILLGYQQQLHVGGGTCMWEWCLCTFIVA